MKQNLTRANDELFRRAPDESFATLPDLWQHCFNSRQRSELLWRRPQDLAAMPAAGRIELATGQTDARRLTSWSFGQLCQLAGVNRETVNRLSAGTAARNAMTAKLGDDADEVMKVLSQHGVTRQLGKEALQIAREQGAFTVFAIVDALTRIAGRIRNAGDRSEVDQKASSLLALAS